MRFSSVSRSDRFALYILLGGTAFVTLAIVVFLSFLNPLLTHLYGGALYAHLVISFVTRNICPHCQSAHVRRSHVRWFEWPIKSLIEPFRCRECRRRFWRRRKCTWWN